MTKIINNDLRKIVEKNYSLQKKLKDLQLVKNEQEIFLFKLQNAKSFKLWRGFNKIKKIFKNNEK